MSQADLFTYPTSPGWKGRDTSRVAAEGMSVKAGTLRDRVLQAIRIRAGTPEEVAQRLGVPVMNVRPRTSELSVMGLIEDSGARGRAIGGRKAIVWKAVAQ